MYSNHSVANFRERKWQQKRTYRVAAFLIHAIAAWGRFVTAAAKATVGMIVFALMIAAVPLMALVAVARKNKLIGILMATALAAQPVAYA
jgi:hypothetical protein